jgi:hypothetical protein
MQSVTMLPYCSNKVYFLRVVMLHVAAVNDSAILAFATLGDLPPKITKVSRVNFASKTLPMYTNPIFCLSLIYTSYMAMQIRT